MKCVVFRENLDDFCRGMLNREMAENMKSHLASCQLCAALHDEHASLLSLLAKEPETVIDPAELADFLPGVWDKIEADRKVTFKGWLRKFAPVAAAVMLFTLMIFRPGIETDGLSISELAYDNYEYGLLDSDQYLLSDDTSEVNQAYSDLLSGLFTDDDSETFELYENMLYGNNEGQFAAGVIDLSSFSEEGLEILDEKLEELLNTAG